MNDQIERLITTSKFYTYLNNVGLNNETIPREMLSQFNMDDFKKFINSDSGSLSPNIYIESLVFNEVNKFLYNSEFNDSFIFENFGKFDIRSIIAASQSLIQRPDINRPRDCQKGVKTPFIEQNFVEVARFERELILKKFGTNESTQFFIIFEGLLPLEVDINPLFSKDPSINIWENEFYNIPPVIQGLCFSANSIESPHVLWINSGLLKTLNLKLDNYKNGLRALNSDNEVILLFRHWREDLIGNGVSFIGTK